MAKYLIVGTHRTSGDRVNELFEADGEAEARQKAAEFGIVVERVERLPEPGKTGSGLGIQSIIFILVGLGCWLIAGATEAGVGWGISGSIFIATGALLGAAAEIVKAR